MLTRHQLIALFDYAKYFRWQAEKLADEAKHSIALGKTLQDAIVKEQTRRAKELKRLETALGAEIGYSAERNDAECPEPTASPEGHATGPRAKRKSSTTGKKSKARAAGTATSSRGKNANAGSGKRKPRTETK